MHQQVERLHALKTQIKANGVFGATEGVELIDVLLGLEPVVPAKTTFDDDPPAAAADHNGGGAEAGAPKAADLSAIDPPPPADPTAE